MKLNLDRFWSEWSLALGILLVLDPRFKLEFVQYGYEQIYGSDANLHLLKFRSSLARIYNRYESDSCSQATPASNINDISCFTSYDPNSNNKFQGFNEWRRQKYGCTSVNSRKSDLDRYLEEPLENLDNISDILAWWHTKASIFPTLGKMARDFLAIPSSAILSKSTFSSKAMTMNPAFDGLNHELMEALICGQDWLETPEKKCKKEMPSFSNARCASPLKHIPKYQAGPFTVSIPVSLEDLKLIQYIFDSSLIGSEIIVQCKHYYLTRSEFCSLRPQTCLDDNVISIVSDAITSVERKREDSVNRSLPICFAEYANYPSECVSFAIKHKIKENYMSNLYLCEKMFVPVFDKERSHFYLYVLHLRKQVVEIWDSLAGSSNTCFGFVDLRLHNMLVCLDTLFEDDIHQNYPDGWSFANFRLEKPTNIPQQSNGYDCGVYVIKFMLTPEEMRQPDFMFNSDEERLKVVL